MGGSLSLTEDDEMEGFSRYEVFIAIEGGSISTSRVERLLLPC